MRIPWQSSLLILLATPRKWSEIRQWSKAQPVSFLVIQQWVNAGVSSRRILTSRQGWHTTFYVVHKPIKTFAIVKQRTPRTAEQWQQLEMFK